MAEMKYRIVQIVAPEDMPLPEALRHSAILTDITATVRTAEQIREACDCVEAVGVGLERKSPEQQAYRNGYLNSQHDIRKALLGEAGVKQ